MLYDTSILLGANILIGSLICPLLRIPSIAIRTLQCPKRKPIYILGHFLEHAGNAPPPFQHITRGYYGTWIGLCFSYAGRIRTAERAMQPPLSMLDA